MPSLQCQECGKQLLPTNSTASGSSCLCSNCGREVYGRKLEGVKVPCPSCGKMNTTTEIV